MHARPDAAVLDAPRAAARGAVRPANGADAQYDRVAAALKAMGRPFPRALAVATGPDLASHVLDDVPGLRLVALEFATMPAQAVRCLGPKHGRRTHATRHVADPQWTEGLGRFDALIMHGMPPLPADVARPARLFAQLRSLVLPGGALLLSGPGDDTPWRQAAPLPDDPERVLAEAGWSSVGPVRAAPGHVLLKARP